MRARFVINWGVHNEALRVRANQRVLNKPEAVAVARDKIATFRKLREANVPHVQFFTSKAEAERVRGNKTILARSTTTGSGGTGIRIIPPGTALPDAPLYTLYFPKTHEYRVHVFNGRAILIQQKRRKTGLTEARTEEQKKIRSHDNGWVFCINDLSHTTEQKRLMEQHSITACAAAGLDFGAVDILVKDNEVVVCEINTMPGLENPSTVEAYATAARSLVPG